MNTYHKDIETLYIAYLGRPADAPGLLHWEQEAESHLNIPKPGGTLPSGSAALQAALAESTEYNALVPDQSPANVVTGFYQNLFGHAPDAGTLTQWTNALASGSVTRATLALEIAHHPQNAADASTLHAKVDAALTFTNSMRNDIIWYVSEVNAAAWRTALAQVTADHPDLPSLSSWTADLQKLYVTYLDRPADPGGLAFWSKALDAGEYTLSGVAAEFAHAVEHLNGIAGVDAPHLVAAIYQDLFDRDADLEGFNYWVNAIQSGQLAAGQAAGAIAEGARGNDAVLLHNKVLASIDFTNSIATPVEVASYAGELAFAQGRDYLHTVTVAEPYPDYPVAVIGVPAPVAVQY